MCMTASQDTAEIPTTIPGRLLVEIGDSDPVEIGTFTVPLVIPDDVDELLVGDAPLHVSVDLDAYRANLAGLLRATADTVDQLDPDAVDEDPADT
jgi:hypothetical protein